MAQNAVDQFGDSNLPINNQKDEATQEFTEQQRQIHQLVFGKECKVCGPAWSILKEHLLEEAKQERRAVAQAVSVNTPTEEIGQKYMVSEIVASKYEQLVQWMETNAEAVQESNKK